MAWAGCSGRFTGRCSACMTQPSTCRWWRASWTRSTRRTCSALWCARVSFGPLKQTLRPVQAFPVGPFLHLCSRPAAARPAHATAPSRSCRWRPCQATARHHPATHRRWSRPCPTPPMWTRPLQRLPGCERLPERGRTPPRRPRRRRGPAPDRTPSRAGACPRWRRCRRSAAAAAARGGRGARGWCAPRRAWTRRRRWAASWTGWRSCSGRFKTRVRPVGRNTTGMHSGWAHEHCRQAQTGV